MSESCCAAKSLTEKPEEAETDLGSDSDSREKETETKTGDASELAARLETQCTLSNPNHSVMQALLEKGYRLVKNVTDIHCQERQLILYTLPCPPLPMIVLRDGQDGPREDFVSSHDVIAVGMEQLGNKVRSDRAFAAVYDSEIITLQLQLHDDFMHQMDDVYAVMAPSAGAATRSDTDPELSNAVYNVMKDYTRRKVAEYMPWLGVKQLPDIRFAEIDAVTKGHVVHTRTVEYICGNRLAVGTHMQERESLLGKSFSELLVLHWRLFCQDGLEDGGAPGLELLDGNGEAGLRLQEA